MSAQYKQFKSSTALGNMFFVSCVILYSVVVLCYECSNGSDIKM